MTQSSTPHKKLNLLQAYRGIAALLVVMVHITITSTDILNQVTFFNLFRAGWSGVDYFFVLSGFIMVYVHRSAIGKKDQLKSFLVKRAVRSEERFSRNAETDLVCRLAPEQNKPRPPRPRTPNHRHTPPKPAPLRGARA